MRSLYVHIPFCARKCLYCDFNSYTNLSLEDEYINALLKEIDSIEQSKFETIFIGGGTPTILSIKNMERLLKSLEKFSPTEFSIESNPGTLSEEILKVMIDGGVNRLSMGLQATQNNILKSLGRIHNFEEFLEGYNNAVKIGFNNINVDLMFAIPNQSLEDFKESLDTVTALNPSHISAYSLIIEEETPFYELNKRGKLSLVDEDVEREMYDYAINYLKSMGYNWYEISNFAKDNKECKHNITYWKNEDYIGVGAGSHSFVGQKRFSNKRGVKDYIEGIKNNDFLDSCIDVSTQDEMSEFMFLGLRMINGIEKNRFKSRFNNDVMNVYGKEIKDLISKGLMEESPTNIYLTRSGIDFSNQVFLNFI